MPRRNKPTRYASRSVPPSVDRALRREAGEHHDVDFLFGSWVEDPLVDRALSDQRVVDEDL